MIIYRRDAEGAEKKSIHRKGAKDEKINNYKNLFFPQAASSSGLNTLCMCPLLRRDDNGFLTGCFLCVLCAFAVKPVFSVSSASLR
jgi:hypothetical protein